MFFSSLGSYIVIEPAIFWVCYQYVKTRSVNLVPCDSDLESNTDFVINQSTVPFCDGVTAQFALSDRRTDKSLWLLGKWYTWAISSVSISYIQIVILLTDWLFLACLNRLLTCILINSPPTYIGSATHALWRKTTPHKLKANNKIFVEKKKNKILVELFFIKLMPNHHCFALPGLHRRRCITTESVLTHWNKISYPSDRFVSLDVLFAK